MVDRNVFIYIDRAAKAPIASALQISFRRFAEAAHFEIWRPAY
jgi:hypothetical protein